MKKNHSKRTPPKPAKPIENAVNPSHPEVPVRTKIPEESKSSEKTSTPDKTTWKEKFEFGSYVATILGVFIVVVLYLITYDQVSDQIEISRMDVQLSERAYLDINIDTVILCNFKQHSWKPLFSAYEFSIGSEVTFKNVGKSPAWLVHAYHGIITDRSSIRDALLHGNFKEYLAEWEMTDEEVAPLNKDIKSFPPDKGLHETLGRAGNMYVKTFRNDEGLRFEVHTLIIYKDIFDNYHDDYLRTTTMITHDSTNALGYRIESLRPLYDFHTYSGSELEKVKALELDSLKNQ